MAGAAQGAFDLVIVGLAVSVPIVVFGSSLVLKLVERFPAIIQIGAALLAFTAAKMAVNEPLLTDLFDSARQPAELVHSIFRWGIYVAAVLGVLVAGWWRSHKARRASMPTQN